MEAREAWGQGLPARWASCVPGVREVGTCQGRLMECQVWLRDIYRGADRLAACYLAALQRARELGEQLDPHLAPLAGTEAEHVVLIDSETCGFHGRPLFLVGAARWREGELGLWQWFARDYSEEAALLARVGEALSEAAGVVSFNGKAFDWPFFRDRMAYHRLPCPQIAAHVDLLPPSRRRWRAVLPDCRLQTLERYLSGRWRAGDISGAEIPQRYHEFVRRQDPRLIAPIFHHNRMDLITMVELLVALVRGAAGAP